MQHLIQAWGKRVEAWHEPDTIRGYPLPRGGQFGNSKEFLDPDIFDERNNMHPWIRGAIVAILAAFWQDRYPDWASWTRIYLAGSLASYWWGTPDFDTLIGINVPLFLKSNPEFVGMTEEEIATMLTQGFYQNLDPLTDNFTFPPSADTMHIVNIVKDKANAGLEDSTTDKLYAQTPANIVPFGPTEITFYVNANSWDIRKIKPYAAYEILHDEWWVYPSIVSKKWGPKALPHNFWEKMADLADEIKRILSTDDPTERQEDAKAMYDRIHGDRGNAFSDMGTGVGDWRSLQWIVLNRWGLLGPLEVAVHPDRPMAHVPPAVASLRMTGALEDLYGSGQAGMDRIFPEGLPKTGSPFPMAGRRRDREDVEWDKVHEAIQHPEGHFDDVDPRTLKGTQPSITRAGVAHYMSHDYRKHEDTFADNDKAGNRHPFVYTRHRDDGTEEHLLLAGHHRAVSDALAGRTTRAIHIHGGFGPARGGR